MRNQGLLFNFIQAEEEHKLMFPKATPRSQLIKLNEEWNEYQKSTSIEEAYQEYADFLFVCISLRRFPETQIIADALLDKYYFSYPIEEQKILMKYLQNVVDKCRIRMARKQYYFKNGLYDRERKKGVKDNAKAKQDR